MTYEFKADDWVEISGRGSEALFNDASQLPDEIWDPGQLVGQDVVIDGKGWRVTGAETFSMSRSQDHPYRFGFGLLVRAGFVKRVKVGVNER